ncbi:hypothetical protein NBT05_16670 [Aquimarina sp. ERC-38]|uniref:hypothetical protein n=1 Tax=Aquimarina sp. ERC-38 TaxID=2949996 RepID=UPI0022450F8B|nr:hypothetical protein [Aquimarina sp. ERC-38]UZO80566.1 hypothetical protein NBT05_16670 [Aquimarina sp. ERC-38]
MRSLKNIIKLKFPAILYVASVAVVSCKQDDEVKKAEEEVSEEEEMIASDFIKKSMRNSGNLFNIRNITFGILCCFLFNKSYSQDLITTEIFLQRFKDSISQDVIEPAMTKNNPILSRVEFRSSTDEFNWNRQEYQLRLEPVSFKKIKIENKLISLYQDEAITDNDLHQQESLSSALKDWIFLKFSEKLIRLHDSLQDVLNDQKLFVTRELENGSTNYLSILKIKSELFKVRTKSKSLKFKASNILKKYNLSNNSQLNFEGLPSVFSIKESLIKKNPLENELLIRKTNLKNKIIDQEIFLEKNENRPFFNFLQFEYQGPHSNSWQNRIAVGASLTIPIEKRNYLKIKELEYKKIDRIQERKADSLLKTQALYNIKDDLVFKIDTYDQIQMFTNQTEKFLEELLTKINTTSMDLNELLKIKKDILVNKISSKILQQEIIEQYVHFSKIQGILK